MGTKANISVSLVLFVLLIGSLGTATAGTIYVDANAAGANNGSSWIDAYVYLQDALADANFDPNVNEIRVAQGIYTPDTNSSEPNGSGDRESTFQLVNSVALRGGYAGFGEPDPNVWDIELYETILTGDLNGDDGPDFANNGENCYHVVTGSGTNETAILEGIIITAGNAEAHWPEWTKFNGGGMYNDAGSPVLINCSFVQNSQRCIGADADGMGGGGIYNTGISSPTLINCTFTGNEAEEYGGGICNEVYSGSYITLINCIFANNRAHYWGSGMHNRGGMLTLTNCTFTENLGSQKGGGFGMKYGIATFSNCTFSKNSNGGIAATSSNLVLNNCVLWGDVGYEIYIGRPSSEGMTVNYSNVQGGETSIIVETGDCTIDWSDGNIDADPCFAAPCNSDYHLQSQAGRWEPNTKSWIQDANTSPCIDAGDPSSSIGWEPYPNGGRINMGAYGGTEEASKSYFGTPVCDKPIAGDVNGDCKVDFIDFAIMAYHWLEDNSQ